MLPQVNDARAQFNATEAKLDQYRKETGRDIKAKIDEADVKVERKAAEAKSTVSGWFK